MSTTLERIRQDLPNLSLEERRTLLQILLDDISSTGFADPDAREAWHQELKKRVAELEPDEVQEIPPEEGFNRIDQSLSSREEP
ncbi:MAG: addiction module protein [bacterium]|jgi:putative addiction module component (TIGR02574 family)